MTDLYINNRCPHRLAPLSEGRIEPADGSLYCNYHGWRFDGQGACRGIPQLDASHSAAAASPRWLSCCFLEYLAVGSRLFLLQVSDKIDLSMAVASACLRACLT